MVEHDKKIMHRLSEHLDAVKEKHPEWVGIFLQGSQNYKLDYEGSDVDSKLIVLPSFEDFVLNRKPQSYTHIMENDEHVDVKEMLRDLQEKIDRPFKGYYKGQAKGIFELEERFSSELVNQF